MRVVTALLKDGCRDFFVAQLSEARELRAHLPSGVALYVLNGLQAGAEAEAIAHSTTLAARREGLATLPEPVNAVVRRGADRVPHTLRAMVPPGARGKLEPAEIFHEILVHRWYLSERAGAEVGIIDTARDYIETVLMAKPEEDVAADT